MNIVDLAILATMALFIYEGLGRNFFAEVLDLTAFLVAFFSSFRFYNYLSLIIEKRTQIPHSLANILGFIALWFLIEGLLFTLIRLFYQKFIAVARLSQNLNFLSLIPATLRGLIFVSLIILIITIFPVQPSLKSVVAQSKIAAFLLDKTARLETPFKNIFGGLAQDTLTFLTIKPRSDEIVKLGFTTSDFTPDQSQEQKMIELVNDERKKQGMATLEFSEKLRQVARVHSSDMFTRGYFAHNSPEGKNVADRADQAEVSYLVIGENLAFAPNLQLAHSGLMNSPGHRANILSNEYHKIGIGIMNGGTYGLMITQVFSN